MQVRAVSNPLWDAFLRMVSGKTLRKREAESFSRAVAKEVRQSELAFAPRWVVAADVAYGGERAVAAVVVWDLWQGRVVWREVVEGPIPAPYQPGLFFLREAPLILPVLARVPYDPWVALIHGHGVAHPLGAGLASVVGVLLGRPAVGCAGSLLCGEGTDPGATKGSWSPVWWQGKRVGAWVRTRTGAKPVVVSVGHAVSLEEAVRLVTAASVYRLPQPLREADRLARSVLRGTGQPPGEEFAPG